MHDRYPSITAEDLARAVQLLGLNGHDLDTSDLEPPAPLAAKVTLVEHVRRAIRRLQASAPADFRLADSVAAEVHPDLLAFVEKADADCPE